MSRDVEFVASWGDRLRVRLGDGPVYIGVLPDRQAQEIDIFGGELEDEDFRWVSVEPRDMLELAHLIIKEYT